MSPKKKKDDYKYPIDLLNDELGFPLTGTGGLIWILLRSLPVYSTTDPKSIYTDDKYDQKCQHHRVVIGAHSSDYCPGDFPNLNFSREKDGYLCSFVGKSTYHMTEIELLKELESMATGWKMFEMTIYNNFRAVNGQYERILQYKQCKPRKKKGESHIKINNSYANREDILQMQTVEWEKYRIREIWFSKEVLPVYFYYEKDLIITREKFIREFAGSLNGILLKGILGMILDYGFP